MQRVTGTLSQGAHPGSYNGQDAYNDVLVTENDIHNGKPSKNGDPDHIKAPRGARTGTQGIKGSIERSKIPKLLCDHIVEICEQGDGENDRNEH